MSANFRKCLGCLLLHRCLPWTIVNVTDQGSQPFHGHEMSTLRSSGHAYLHGARPDVDVLQPDFVLIFATLDYMRLLKCSSSMCALALLRH